MKIIFRIQKADGQHPPLEVKKTHDKDDDMLSRTLASAKFNAAKDVSVASVEEDILGTIKTIITGIEQSVIENKPDFEGMIDICKDIRTNVKGLTKDNPQSFFALSQLKTSVKRIDSELALGRRGNGTSLSITINRNDIAAWEKELRNAFRFFTVCFRNAIPVAPSMFYGRGELVNRLARLVVNDPKNHIALIGTGGVGKSSLAKAIFDELDVIKKFAERRFFITYDHDGLDPSTITFDMFMARLAEHLTKGSGCHVNPMLQISTSLRSAPTLIFLDTAETFEAVSESIASKESKASSESTESKEFTAPSGSTEPMESTAPIEYTVPRGSTVPRESMAPRESTALSGSTAYNEPTVAKESTTPRESTAPNGSTACNEPTMAKESTASNKLEKILLAIVKIAEIKGVVLILTFRNEGDLPGVLHLEKNIIPPLDIDAACQIYPQLKVNCNDPEEDSKIKILEVSKFCPLTINLLASAAQQNNWSPPMLLKRWKNENQHREKLERLSVVIQLSLSSPSIHKLGKDGLRTLATIAFLPQGLNVDLAKDLLPSIRESPLYVMLYASNFSCIVKAHLSRCSHPFDSM